MIVHAHKHSTTIHILPSVRYTEAKGHIDKENK